MRAYLILFLFGLTLQAQALVDYTDSGSSTGADRTTPHQMVRKRAPSRPRQNVQQNGSRFLDLSLKYESLSDKARELSGGSQRLAIEGHIQTQNSYYVDFSYWQASSSENEFAEESGFQNGNPKLSLGFNWMRLGQGADAATVDFYFGASLKDKDSEFATSRNDTFFGVKTNKRFDEFLLGIGFEYVLTGNPKNDDELDVGNIRRIHFGIAWMATPTVHFALEGISTQVNEGEGGEGQQFLDESTSFSSLSPKLRLLLNPAYSLELGAVFNTKKSQLEGDTLYQAGLYQESGATSNTLYTSLNFGI